MAYAELMIYRAALNADELGATSNASAPTVLHASLEVYASLQAPGATTNRAQSMSEISMSP